MERKKLPIGVDSFEKLRTEGFYYIDKTLFIRDLLNGWCKANLFTRPRRFGKTLNMSMLKAFFEIGGDSSLFKGLAISDEKELCEEYMGKYPVVFVSLKNVDGLTFDGAYSMLRIVIRNEVSRLSFLSESETIPEDDKRAFDRFRKENDTKADVYDSIFMLTRLLEKHYGQKAILLIDEYDVPLDKAYQHGYYDEMVDLIRNMFGAALKTNDSLYFAALTGYLCISNESIFTGLNNLKVHSIADAQFDEYFGFTGVEVDRILDDYGLSAHRTEMKDWYDGYRFGEQDVYCPWDVINYCHDLVASKKATPKVYWLNASGNDMVRLLIDRADTGTIRMEIEDLIAGASIRKRLNDGLTHNEIDRDIDSIWSLLFMTGYLTMRGRASRGIYELGIPNSEVRQIYMKQVRAWFKDNARANVSLLTELFTSFESGNTAKIKEMLDEQLLSTVSFHDAYETFYHGFLLALLSTCTAWSVVSNAETGKGRSDIIVEREDGKLGFVVEVKVVKDERELRIACENALWQIEEKDYTATLRRYRVKDIWIYGIAFYDKECMVLTKHLTEG